MQPNLALTCQCQKNGQLLNKINATIKKTALFPLSEHMYYNKRIVWQESIGFNKKKVQVAEGDFSWGLWQHIFFPLDLLH